MNESDSNQAPEALRSLRSLKIEASPYLSARLKANLQATAQFQNQSPKASSFKGLFKWATAALAFAMIAVVVAVQVLRPGHGVDAATYALNQPYMIRMDIRALPKSEIAFAEIDLDGDSARFASKKFSDVPQRKKLVIEGDRVQGLEYIPVVLQGVKSGKATVKVSFFDAHRNVVATKSVELTFVGDPI